MDNKKPSPMRRALDEVINVVRRADSEPLRNRGARPSGGEDAPEDCKGCAEGNCMTHLSDDDVNMLDGEEGNLPVKARE